MPGFEHRLLAAAAVLGAATLASCSSVPRQLVAPQVQMTSLSLIQPSVDFQRFAVTLRVDNANEFDIPIEGIRFSARLSGQGVLMGDSSEPATLPARGSETLRVEVTTETVSSFAALQALAQGPDDAIAYELNGALRLASGLDRRIRFSYAGRVPLSAAPRATR